MKATLRILATTGILALAAFAAQPKANAQVGVFFGFQSPHARVVVGVPPRPGPGYYWIPGYYSGSYWIPGRWAYRGDDDYHPYRYDDDDDGGYGYGYYSSPAYGFYGYRGGDYDHHWRRRDDDHWRGERHWREDRFRGHDWRGRDHWRGRDDHHGDRRDHDRH